MEFGLWEKYYTEILDDEAELDDTENSELTGFVDQFDDEEQNDK